MSIAQSIMIFGFRGSCNEQCGDKKVFFFVFFFRFFLREAGLIFETVREGRNEKFGIIMNKNIFNMKKS